MNKKAFNIPSFPREQLPVNIVDLIKIKQLLVYARNYPNVYVKDIYI
ncbi:hypothetical protein AB1K81_14215 [Ornithinibacillus sp. 179-J 7C1 HS]